MIRKEKSKNSSYSQHSAHSAFDESYSSSRKKEAMSLFNQCKEMRRGKNQSAMGFLSQMRGNSSSGSQNGDNFGQQRRSTFITEQGLDYLVSKDTDATRQQSLNLPDLPGTLKLRQK